MTVLFLALAATVAAQAPDSTRITAPQLDRIVIDAATIARDGSARTVSEVLLARVPGVLVVPGSGLNASGASIRLAGVRSLAADEPPLFLVDGFRIDTREDDSQMALGGPGPSRLDDIALEDVESIEVLRGPAATAAYGPGASTGVILIRTKTGESGSVRMEGVVQGGLHSVPTRWPANYGGVDLDNASTFLQNGGCTLSLEATGACAQDFVQSFNPLVERNPFGNAPARQLGLSVTGGPAWGAFRFSGMLDGDAAVYSVPAITWDDDSRRWSVRASGSVHPVRSVNVSATVARMSSRVQLPMYGPVRNALTGTSDSTGFTWTPYFQAPAAQDFDRTQVGITAEARLVPWLSLQAALGRDDDEYHELREIPAQVRATGERTGANHTYRFTATASDIPLGHLRFSTTVGVERLTNRDETTVEQTSAGSSTFQNIVRRVDSWGYYGIERIAIHRRWFVTGTLRHDTFDDFDAWSATHPSVAVDWVARQDQEGTLGGVTLRAAYGTADQSPPTAQQIFFVGPTPPFPSAKPERTREFAVSALASGLAGRLSAQLAVYDAHSDVLAYTLMPLSTGPAPALYVPGAEISNRGVSAILSAKLIDRATWGWDLQLSLWGNRNRVVKYPIPTVLYGDLARFAQGDYQGYPANGYWSRPLISFADGNGDGIIAPNEVVTSATAVWAGQPYPTQGAAMISSWRIVRQLRVSAMLDYRAGQTLFNETSNTRCQAARCRERIDPATPLAAQANAIAAPQLPLSYFEDADYLKLRELTFAFDLPAGVLSALRARAATIAVGGRNLLTWTRYSGPDPEAGSYGRHVNGSPTVVGDNATIPIPASWLLRVRVSY